MNLVAVLLIAVGLAMDAFAVSVSIGMTCCDFRWSHNLRMSAMFGLFQCAMPVIGFYAATRFQSYIENFDHWIAFVLLLFIGGKMLWEAFTSKNADELLEGAPACPVIPTADPGAVIPAASAGADLPVDAPAQVNNVRKGYTASEMLTFKRILILAVATSIDALAVGVSFAFLKTDIWIPSILIGIVAFAFSFTGGFLGRKIGPVLGKTAEIMGGLILCGIGIKILLDHLFFT
jgi:putative Mn2+ efflux pump MntP